MHESDGSVVVPGSFPVHDLIDLAVQTMSEDATTVGGLLTEQLGRLPIVGDTVTIDGDVFEVLEVRRRTATRVRIVSGDARSAPAVDHSEADASSNDE